MPTRETSPNGAPCWIDLLTSDTDRARAFYTTIFGWTADEPAAEYGGYFIFSKDGAAVGGCMGRQPDNPTPDTWAVYLQSDDTAKTLELATSNGGQVLVDAMTVGAFGTMGVATDPAGAAVGVWQPGTNKGFGVLGEPGAPSWFELNARGYDAAIAFYREVFGWETSVMSDTAELRYTLLVEGGVELAGVVDAAGFLPDGVPSHWSVYFAVAETDVAIAQVIELGGSVLRAAEDTPYGRLATVADPMGASFKLMARG